jgi:excisionase family DNA binding protein
MARATREATGAEMLGTCGGRRPERHSSSPAGPPEQRLLLTVSEAAQRLGIGRSLLYELLTGGKIESFRRDFRFFLCSLRSQQEELWPRQHSM